jgi:DNA-binding CsgD family transcriptional regulator
MTERTIITTGIATGSEPLPRDPVGALLGFMQRLTQAEDAEQVFEAFSAFADAERIGDLLLEVDSGEAPVRWTAVEPDRLQCYEDSGVARALRDRLAGHRLPNATAWGASDHAGAYPTRDLQARARLRAGGIAGGLFATMHLPSGRNARAHLLAGATQSDAMPAIASDLFLVAAIQAFLVLDRCLGPVPPKGLTRRELEALGLSARGLTTRVIAETMQISEATVKFHLVGARRKANAGNTREAIAIFSNII